jgi:hypothetical protein
METTTFTFLVSYAKSQWNCPLAHLDTCPKRSKYPTRKFTAEGPDPYEALEAHEKAAYTANWRHNSCVGARCCVDPKGLGR